MSAAPSPGSSPAQPPTVDGDRRPRSLSEGPQSAPVTLLIVDDEPLLVRSLAKLFRGERWRVLTASGGRQALDVVLAEPVDVVLLDMKMPDMSGADVLTRIKATHPDIQVIMMTAYGTIETAVAAIRAGAHDFLTKPFDPLEQVERSVARAAEHKRVLARNRFLESQLDLRGDDYYGLVGRAPAMRTLFSQIEVVRQVATSVLVQGESGTGKELIARALHHGSPRTGKPFVAVNCSALPEQLLESELFGHVRGAFTGAVSSKAGLFERAHGGTLLLDEIGDMPAALQAKLLRVLQDGEIRRVGATDARRVDVRVIAATHVDLHRAMGVGRFREDLYYRLAVITIEAPALRDRADDIPVLAQHFMHVHAKKADKPIERLEYDALDLLTRYRWPGNVRELENVMERAVVMSRGPVLGVGDLPPRLRLAAVPSDVAPAGDLCRLPFSTAKALALQAFEQRYVRDAMTRSEGNVSRASRIAGLDRSNFKRLMRRYPQTGGHGGADDSAAQGEASPS